MKNNQKLKSVISVIIAVLLFASFSVFLLMLTFSNQLKSLPDMTQKIANEEYMALVRPAFESRLRITLALSALEPDDISNVFTDDILKDNAVKALQSTLNTLVGREADEITFDCDGLEERINEKLTAYAEENEIPFDEEGAKETYETIKKSLAAEFSVLPAKYLKKISPAINKLTKILSLWFVPLITSVIIATAIILLCKDNLAKAFIRVSTPLYFSSFILAVFFFLLKDKDYLSSTVIAKGLLAKTIHNVYNIICGNALTLYIIFTALFAVMLIASIIVLCFKKQKKTEEIK